MQRCSKSTAAYQIVHAILYYHLAKTLNSLLSISKDKCDKKQQKMTLTLLLLFIIGLSTNYMQLCGTNKHKKVLS